MGLICGSRWPPPTPAERGLTGYRAGGFRPGVTMHRGDAVAAEFDIAIIHAAEAKGWRERVEKRRRQAERGKDCPYSTLSRVRSSGDKTRAYRERS